MNESNNELKVIQEIKDSKYKLSEETAINEIEKMLEYYAIGVNEIKDEQLKSAIELGYERLIKAVRLGRLEIKLENGIQVIQTLRNGSTKITYKEIDGNAKSAMAGKKPDDHYGKSYALMGSLSGLGESAIKQLRGVDLSLAEVLGLIFLSV